MTASERVWVVAPLLLCTGCLSHLFTGAGTVRDEFVEAQSCPDERVTVVETPRPYWLRPPPPPVPPPEVARDADRAALWAELHPRENWDDRRFFKADGCGHLDFYMCDVWVANADDSVSPVCIPAPDDGQMH